MTIFLIIFAKILRHDEKAIIRFLHFYPDYCIFTG